jgi:hypothetical protein
MSSSYTLSETTTFTLTHAKHMASKVATDLKRIQRLYGDPSDSDIASYEAEVIELIRHGYLGSVTYGYRRFGNWVEPTLKYTSRDLAGGTANDDDPGRIRSGSDVSNASFYSYLTYSASWDKLSDAEKESFKNRLPFSRTGVPAPGVNGYFTDDRSYSAGGWALSRSSVRS